MVWIYIIFKMLCWFISKPYRSTVYTIHKNGRYCVWGCFLQNLFSLLWPSVLLTDINLFYSTSLFVYMTFRVSHYIILSSLWDTNQILHIFWMGNFGVWFRSWLSILNNNNVWWKQTHAMHLGWTGLFNNCHMTF